MSDRTDAFVSYSHADQQWLARLQLRTLEREHGLMIWTDSYSYRGLTALPNRQVEANVA